MINKIIAKWIKKRKNIGLVAPSNRDVVLSVGSLAYFKSLGIDITENEERAITLFEDLMKEVYNTWTQPDKHKIDPERSVIELLYSVVIKPEKMFNYFVKVNKKPLIKYIKDYIEYTLIFQKNNINKNNTLINFKVTTKMLTIFHTPQSSDILYDSIDVTLQTFLVDIKLAKK